MQRSRSSSLTSEPSVLQTCQACWRKARRGRTGDQGSSYSNCWYCEHCWSSWEQNDKPWKLCHDFEQKCRREGCPYMRCSTNAIAFCCWECGSGKEHSRTHDSWCERRRCDADTGISLQAGIPIDPANFANLNSSAASPSQRASTPRTLEERVDAVMRGLESSHSVLQQPLAYAVVRNDPRYPPYACVRDAPDAGAQEVGRLPHGRTVYGFPSVGWLRLGADNGADLEGQWVFIGRQLAACCLQIAVRERRTDGLEVEWAGVPGARATYSVDWELGVGAAAGARGHNTLVSSPLAALAELPAGCAVRVRVLALLAAPGAEGAGAAPMRVFGPWLETATEAAAPERPGGAAAGAGGAAEAGEAGGLGEAPAAAAARPGAAARDGGAREAPGAGAPRPAPPAARGPRAEAEAGRGGAGAPEEGLEESAQPRAARGRKWSVRDLVESFEAKYAFNAKAMWECRACGRLLPREARAGCLCEAAPPGAPAPGAARPRAAGAE